MTRIANAVFVRPDKPGLKVGLRATRLFHPDEKVERVGLLLGGKTAVADVASGQLTDKFMAKRGSSVIWTHPDAMPELQKVGDGEIIKEAGIIELGRQKFLVRLEDLADGSCIVHVETGVFGELSLTDLKEKILFPHGSFSLDQGSTLVGMQETLGELALPKERGLARRLKWRVTRDIDETKIPWHRNDVWRMLPGGAVIVQGIGGESFRLVCEKNHVIRRVDMPNGNAVFERLEGERLERNARKVAARVAQTTPSTVREEAQAPEVAAAPAEVPAEVVAEDAKPARKGWSLFGRN